MKGLYSLSIDNCNPHNQNKKEKPLSHGNPKQGSAGKPKFGNRDQNSNKAKAQKLPDQVMKISILCAGQIFGNEDVLNARNYTTTVKCLSTEA